MGQELNGIVAAVRVGEIMYPANPNSLLEDVHDSETEVKPHGRRSRKCILSDECIKYLENLLFDLVL